MRESIGGAWLMGLMVTFILLFTSFIIVTINYTRAFRVKNEMLNFIERGEGLTTGPNGSMQLIANYLIKSNQLATGKCQIGEMGVFDLTYDIMETVTDKNAEYYYCVQKYENFDPNELQKAYYNVTIFFDFNIPVFGDLFKFSVNGNTTNIQYPADINMWR